MNDNGGSPLASVRDYAHYVAAREDPARELVLLVGLLEANHVPGFPVCPSKAPNAPGNNLPERTRRTRGPDNRLLRRAKSVRPGGGGGAARRRPRERG
eukprot:7168784-Alexandrium_andersonii.AAC.1